MEHDITWSGTALSAIIANAQTAAREQGDSNETIKVFLELAPEESYMNTAAEVVTIPTGKSLNFRVPMSRLAEVSRTYQMVIVSTTYTGLQTTISHIKNWLNVPNTKTRDFTDFLNLTYYGYDTLIDTFDPGIERKGYVTESLFEKLNTVVARGTITFQCMGERFLPYFGTWITTTSTGNSVSIDPATYSSNRHYSYYGGIAGCLPVVRYTVNSSYLDTLIKLIKSNYPTDEFWSFKVTSDDPAHYYFDFAYNIVRTETESLGSLTELQFLNQLININGTYAFRQYGSTSGDIRQGISIRPRWYAV